MIPKCRIQLFFEKYFKKMEEELPENKKSDFRIRVWTFFFKMGFKTKHLV
tara:strand:- start:195 stop:344 length:150 start_codon:yes stop_codon:yes gene_type:complete